MRKHQVISLLFWYI